MGRVHELFDQVIYILVTRNQSIRDVDCSAVSLNLGSAHFFEFFFRVGTRNGKTWHRECR